MRAALGLALVAGGALLVLMALHGRTPFDGSTSPSGGSAPTAPIQNPLAASQIAHYGGMP